MGNVPCNIEGGWEFLCEPYLWPMVHFLVPGFVYRITRSYWFTFFLMSFWEIVEKVTAASSSKDSLDMFAATDEAGNIVAASAESVMDSVGDIFMGSLACLVVHMLEKVLDAPRMLPDELGWSGYRALWLKYAFQLLLYAAPTPAIQLYIAGTNNILSVGWLVMLISWPVLTLFCGWWNEDDPVWRYVERAALTNTPVTDADRAALLKTPFRTGRAFFYVRTTWHLGAPSHYWRAVYAHALFYLFTTAIMVWPFFASAFFRMLLVAGVELLVLWFLWASLPRYAMRRCDDFVFMF